MDDPSILINRFIVESDAARKLLESKHGVLIDSVTLQAVLTERLGLTSSIFLIDQNLDQTRILEIVADHDFKSLVATVEMNCDILPEGVLRLLTEAEATVNNQIWRVHKSDVDFFPSDPHAHNVETGVKLDLGNGWTYRKRKPLGRIKTKHLLALREKIETKLLDEGIQLPALAV